MLFVKKVSCSVVKGKFVKNVKLRKVEVVCTSFTSLSPFDISLPSPET